MLIDITIINSMLTFWLKPMLILLFVLFFTRWSNARSPHTCHWELITLSSLTFIIIPFSFFLPKINIAIISPTFFSELKLNMPFFLELGVSTWRVYLYIAIGIYLIIALFSVNLHVADWLQARTLVKRARFISRKEMPLRSGCFPQCCFKESAGVDVPVVWGLRNPIILLPITWRDWPTLRLQRVLTHEFAHIQRCDWAIKNCLIICRSFLWFVPPVWTAVRRALEYAEYACDDDVISEMDCRSDYAQDLLVLSVKGSLNSSFVAVASSELACRLHLILEGGRDRSKPKSLYKIAVIMTALVLFLPFYSIAITHKEMSVIERGDVDLTLDIYSFSSDNTDIDSNDIRIVKPIMNEERVYVRAYKSNTYGPESINKHVDSIPRLDSKSEQASKLSFAILQPLISVSGYLPTKLVSPDYPEKALERGIEASIDVRFDIDTRGRAYNIRFISNEKSALFHRVIKSALSESRFQSSVIDGYMTELYNVEERYVFKISNQ